MNNVSNKLDRLPSNYTFGVEIEYTGGATFAQATYFINLLISRGEIRPGWTVHYDSSVVDQQGQGAEIVSPVLTDDEQTEKELKIITNYIKSTGGVMNEQTGGHVHYGTQCLGNNIEEIKQFLKLYTIFEPLLYKLSTGDLDYVRPGCGHYAKPMQNKLFKVIDSKTDSLSSLFLQLATTVGANTTHYGEHRYYGLNFQRLFEALRQKPQNITMESYLNELLTKGIIKDKNGHIISPTIEMRFRNGSSDPDEIMRGIRMGGQLFVAAKRKNYKKDCINSLYRHAKKRIVYIFDRLVEGNSNSPLYSDCTDIYELLRKKFRLSDYGNGKITYDEFKAFMNILYPNMKEKDILKLAKVYLPKLKPTPYKLYQEQEYVNNNNMVRRLALAA